MSLNNLKKKPNLLLIITDQQRAVQHWPPGWAMKNLPAMRKLMKNGITFKRGYTNTCMCSPSRATLFTSSFPSNHGVKEVLNIQNQYYTVKDGAEGQPCRDLQGIMRSQYQNMAKILASQGYDVHYKGKWHLTKPVTYDQSENTLKWSDKDIPHIAGRWGFKGWNPPDAGDTITAQDMGGGKMNNDGRFVDGKGTRDGVPQNQEQLKQSIERSAVEFLNNYDSEKPFCLIVSLVNPHDVLSYPGTAGENAEGVPIYQQGGYTDEEFENLPIGLPETWQESLITKPTVQLSVKEGLAMGLGTLPTKEDKLKYVRFYAYLHTVVDQEIMKVLNALDQNELTDDTVVVRVSDHGEMGLAHGGLRQKIANMYNETVRVPIIFSNPKLFPEPVVTDSMAGLIDVLPTMAQIAGMTDKVASQVGLQGTSLAPVFENPDFEVQDHIHFTYDDYDTSYPVDEPAKIRAIFEKEWKYAVYFDDSSGFAAQYELYNLVEDPLETTNLAHPTLSTPETMKVQQRLHIKLLQTMEDFGTVPDGIIFPKVTGTDPNATHPDSFFQGTILEMVAPDGVSSNSGSTSSDTNS